MRIDSHVHFWNADQIEDIPIARGIDALRRPFLPDDLAAVAMPCGVGKIVLVEAAPDTAETELILESTRDVDLVAAVVGWVDLDESADHIASEINRFRAFPKFRGIRSFSPGGFDGRWLAGETVTANYRWLMDNDVTVEFLINHDHLPATHALVTSIPGFRPLINHGARPVVMSGELEPWASNIGAVARDTEAVCKLSALCERAGVEWRPETVYPYIATLVEAFGPDRLMFGSNWPVMTIMSTYRRWVDALDAALARLGLSAEDQDAIYRRTAMRFYGITS